MELKKIQIHKNCQKGTAVSQLTLDDDYNVPDYKPDIVKILKEKGEIRFDEINVSTGAVWLKGSLVFHVLYRSDQENRKISSLKGEIPFQEKLSIDGVMELDPVRLLGEVEDISISVINSRKLSVRALVVLHAIAEENMQEEIACGVIDGEECEEHRKEKEILELVTAKKDSCRLKNELVIPSNKPNVQEILWKSVEIRHLEYSQGEGEIILSGEALITVLYYGEEEEARIQWYETSVALEGHIECPGLGNEEVFHVTSVPNTIELEIKPDYDGEERILVLEIVLDLDIKVWRESRIEVLEDLYSLKKEITPKCEETVLEKLKMKNYAKCRMTEQMKLKETQEKILQICACEGIVQVENQERTEDGLMVDGTLTVELLYITTEDNMPVGSVKEIFPFRQLIEVSQMRDNMRIELESGVEQLSAILLDQSQAEIKAVLNLNLLAFEEEKICKITELEMKELDIDALQQAPGLIGYIIRPGDCLWEIAKENHTTMEEIMMTNQLKSEQLQAGDKILIVKHVAS
ncbi:MAG: SPOCS domain-containing protein [Roseburia sp.]